MLLKYLFIIILSLNLFSYDRIVALSPSINEIIYALSSEGKLVGNTDFCNYPEASKKKQKVGGYFSPSLEKILFLKPDIVIMQQNNIKLSKKLDKLGIKTRILSLNTLEDIKQTIKVIGQIVKKEQKAQELLNTLQKKLQNIKNIVQNKKILIAIGHNTSLEKRIFVAGQNLYFDDIINISGNTNAFKSSRKGQPVLNMENIISANADIVILLSPYRKEKGLSKKQLIDPWRKLPINAAKDDNIFIVDKDYAGISSHRLIYFLEDFRGFLEDVRAE
jgi:iron complex transport system substrate-binding protein